MYSCLRCDWSGECPKIREDYRGEYQGKDAYEREECCPNCGYDVTYDDDNTDYDDEDDM